MKVLGYNDGVHTCDCCGKSELKGTFGVQLETGEVVHYGSVCVTRHTGKTKAVIVSEVAKREAEEKARKEAEYSRTFEAIRYAAKMNEAHKLRLIGKAFKDFCTTERIAADLKRTEIFA